MGCDIHLYVERQRKDGSWTRVPDTKGPRHPYYTSNGTEEQNKFLEEPCWDTGRDYLLFGRLAGVRRDVLPIAEPRGIPADISKSVAKQWKDGMGDWHTPSYLSAQELLAAKDEPIQHVTCLSMKEYKLYLNNGSKILPEDDKFMWGRPRNLKLISNEEMERMISLSAFWDGENYYTNILSPAPELELDPYLWDSIVPAMLAVEPDPKKIRIVFWFDN